RALSFGSALSGAGSNSQRSPNMSSARGRPVVLLAGGMSVALRGLAEVIRRLVRSGPLPLELPEEVVEERAGADPVPPGGEPRVAQGLLDRDQVLERVLRRPN